MERPKCQIKGCERGAILAYGNRWICGECYMKILSKQMEIKNKEMEALEEELNAN